MIVDLKLIFNLIFSAAMICHFSISALKCWKTTRQVEKKLVFKGECSLHIGYISSLRKFDKYIVLFQFHYSSLYSRIFLKNLFLVLMTLRQGPIFFPNYFLTSCFLKERIETQNLVKDQTLPALPTVAAPYMFSKYL